jgi:hypothetical protein
VLKENSLGFLEIIASALERMAFIVVEPVEGPSPAPAPRDPVWVRVPLWLPEAAAVEMIAPESFGAHIAANAMALGPDETVPPDQARDALAEFLNILASALLLPDNADLPTGRIVKGVPEVMALARPTDWDQFITHDDTILFNAEGCIVACRLVRGR